MLFWGVYHPSPKALSFTIYGSGRSPFSPIKGKRARKEANSKNSSPLFPHSKAPGHTLGSEGVLIHPTPRSVTRPSLLLDNSVQDHFPHQCPFYPPLESITIPSAESSFPVNSPAAKGCDWIISGSFPETYLPSQSGLRMSSAFMPKEFIGFMADIAEGSGSI